MLFRAWGFRGLRVRIQVFDVTGSLEFLGLQGLGVEGFALGSRA